MEWLAAEGFNPRVVSFEEWRMELFKTVLHMENGGWEPYLPLIEEVEQKQIFMPQIDLSNTLARLEGSGIHCQPVNAELMSTYFRAFYEHGLIPKPEIKPL